VRVLFASSALVKRYIRAAGTDEVLARPNWPTELAVAVIAVPEVSSALCRLVRERRLGEAPYAALKADLGADLADAAPCETSPQVVQAAVVALETHPLRAKDALHVAAALVGKADLFVSADAPQCAAAAAPGLEVVQV
jgi:predicted nucleic acid-binding protein